MFAQSSPVTKTIIGRRHIVLTLLSYAVAVNGIIIIASALHYQFEVHGWRTSADGALLSIPLVTGITLLYLSALLRRRKRAAWAITLLVYAVILCGNILRLLSAHSTNEVALMQLAWDILLPSLIVSGLAGSQQYFTVKSDLRSFGSSLKVAGLLLLVTLLYGVAGFMLMEHKDFRQHVGIGEAIHHTIDQFGITTPTEISPHTRRAVLFMQSLTILSSATVLYIIISFFQPLKARFSDQSRNRALAKELLEKHGGNSEDFFKLWPHDKYYYFNAHKTAGVAYSVRNGIVLVVGDPMGSPNAFPRMVEEFVEMCRLNDWRVAFVHVDTKHLKLYKEHHFALQKIGEEAVIDIEAFTNEVADTKYFRHIRNRFDKQGFSCELLQPPHSKATLDRLAHVSSDWLKLPGRDERGFMMGYFNRSYMQKCSIVVLRDRTHTIQGFLNQIPSYDRHEANFDVLRYTSEALGNSGDRILLSFIEVLKEQGYERLNLGLCPLSGLDDSDQERSVVNNALHFLYANGDRFYSFSGLQRFKAKYEPQWEDRYIAYRGGVRTLPKVLAALTKAMKLPAKK